MTKALREALLYVRLNKLTPKEEAMPREMRETRNSFAHLILLRDDIGEVVFYKLVCLKNKLAGWMFNRVTIVFIMLIYW